jgi:uncharacterized membrane-anchored protein
MKEKKYSVYVDDNFHYMDKDSRYKLGDFDSCEEAVQACKKIVDEFFEQYLKESKNGKLTAKGLYGGYTAYGEDPYIISDDKKCKFSAWDYAKERSKELGLKK